MARIAPSIGSVWAALPDDVQAMIEVLHRRGYTVVGPAVRDGVIAFHELLSSQDLPIGLRDAQAPGEYELTPSNDKALFSCLLPSQGLKARLYPAALDILSAKRAGKGFVVENGESEHGKLAFLGARACDIAALLVLDGVLGSESNGSSQYRQAREAALIIAVNCGRAVSTCFCASMGTGPRATQGFDLCLTELLRAEHRIVVEIGSEKGAEVVAELDLKRAEPAMREEVDREVRRARSDQSREVKPLEAREILYRNTESPRWEQIALRCLACGNCTMVCPTCFCVTVEDTTSLDGAKTTRTRRWDSCFSADFTFIHGGAVRLSTMSRYRHWITHKLAAWHDQFGVCGCVGCGRCITWCPVGIDITEEVAALKAAELPSRGRTDG